ncbi:hypothetical protein R5R35_009302 [Gryllus longicercus]|uniref:Uncharacterized protein n=2 Tax=Gryllus longicercus TaxID=2509291 RepID=A0AAN9ZGZ1_9ORTH
MWRRKATVRAPRATPGVATRGQAYKRPAPPRRRHVAPPVQQTNSTMKAVVAVLFALVAVARAGLLGGTYTALTAPALAAPYALGAHGLAAPYAAAVAAPYALGVHGLAAPYAAGVAAPYAAAVHAPVAVAAPAVSYAAHASYAAPIGAAYKAVTRGAVHTAPLPGHAIGSAHVNVQPAPGTL